MELLIERAKKQSKAKKRSFMKKHILQLGGHAVANVSRTIAHRVTKGPIYPNFSVRNELFYQLMLELMDKHYLLSWQEWRHLMPMQPIPRWHLRRTKVVLKNELKTEFITYVPRRRRRSKREKKLRKDNSNNSTDTEGAASSVSDAEDNHSHRSNSDRESDMFYGDEEDFEDGDGAGHDGSDGHHQKHKLDGKTQIGNGTNGAVAGQIVDGPADGNYRGVKDIGLDTPTIIYFHGGGFCFGSVPVYRRWLWTFSRKLGGIRFFAVDYSLAPEAPFPIALKQALDAYLWLTDPNGGGVSPQNVIMGGDSAGGNLVGSLLLLLRQLRLEKELEIMNGQKRAKSHAQSAEGHHHQSDLQNQPTTAQEAEPGQLKKSKRRASLTSSKGKEVNEPEQMIDETSDQKQERMQDDQLEFGDGNEEDAQKERQLHRELQVRRQSVADMKGAAQVAKKKIAADRKLKEKVHSSSVDEDNLLDADSEAAGLPTLKAIDFDMKLVESHRIPFELDDDQVGAYPSMPLAAIQISPWVDVSENSSVHSPDSWGLMKFRPYNISVRFALAYLGLEATNPEEAKKKEKETRKEYNGIVKLFHNRKASRRQRLMAKKNKHGSTSTEQDATSATASAPQLGMSGADGHHMQPAIVPSLYLDDEPAVVAQGTTELTTAMWRDRMRRRNSVLSCTNLLARSAARSALQTGEVEIAIGEKPHDVGGPVSVDADALGHVATSLTTTSAEQAEAQDQGESSDVFDICSPYISPVYGDLRGFPPLLVSAGDVEPLLGDIMRYYNKAVEVGVEAELDLGVNMNHDYQFFFSAVAMNDPQIPRFWGVAREWVHRQIQRDVQPSGSSKTNASSSSSSSSATNETSKATIAPSSPATAHIHA